MKIHSGSADVTGTLEQGGDGIVILETLSAGRVFRILKARHGARYVALKAAVENNAMSVSLLKREYELCRDLSHPCVVSVLGFEEDTPVGPAIEMEYISGRTLDEFVADAPSEAQLRTVLRDILDGVDYLHHRGILHNDLKPDNIVVNVNGAARIIDFGLSESGDCVYAGTLGGTCGYSAPEVLDGRGSAGAASDIYSVGKIINLLFGGRRYRRVARRCCCPEPTKRFQSVTDIRKAMSAAGRRPYVLTGVAVLLIVLMGLMYVYERIGRNVDTQIDSYSKQVLDMTGEMYQEAVYDMKTVAANIPVDSMVDSHIEQQNNMARDKFEQLMEKAAAETDWFYQEALDSIKNAPDKATCIGSLSLFYTRLGAYQDSVMRSHPVSQDDFPPETKSALEVTRRYMIVVDSIYESLPENLALEKFRESLPGDMERLSRQVWTEIQTQKSIDSNYYILSDILRTVYGAHGEEGRLNAYVDSVMKLYPKLAKQQVRLEVSRAWKPHGDSLSARIAR